MKSISFKQYDTVDFKGMQGIKIPAQYVSSKEVKTQKGVSMIHLFKDADNNEFQIWGMGQLNKRLELCGAGSFVQISYEGKPGEYHNCSVDLFDNEDEMKTVAIPTYKWMD